MLENIIDFREEEQVSPFLYKFQIIEFVLIILFITISMISIQTGYSNLSIALLLLLIITSFYQIARISFEYKNKLITQFGILLKIFLLLFTLMIFIGLWMKSSEHPLANLVLTASLLSTIFPYLIFAIALNKIVIKTKLVLIVNSICLTF